MEVLPNSKALHRAKRRRSIELQELQEAMMNTSSVYETCKKLGVGNASVYKALKRFGLEKPQVWVTNHRFRIGRLRRQRPTSILESEQDRMWVGLLVGTECGLQATYEKRFNFTELKVSLGMTERAYVERFARLCNVSPPRHAAPRNNRSSDVWSREIKGLRALMVLREVIPYLLGDKLKQAKRAIEFFSPTGYRKGRFSSADVWPRREFPLRRKGPAHQSV